LIHAVVEQDSGMSEYRGHAETQRPTKLDGHEVGWFVAEAATLKKLASRCRPALML